MGRKRSAESRPGRREPSRQRASTFASPCGDARVAAIPSAMPYDPLPDLTAMALAEIAAAVAASDIAVRSGSGS